MFSKLNSFYLLIFYYPTNKTEIENKSNIEISSMSYFKGIYNINLLHKFLSCKDVFTYLCYKKPFVYIEDTLQKDRDNARVRSKKLINILK